MAAVTFLNVAVSTLEYSMTRPALTIAVMMTP